MLRIPSGVWALILIISPIFLGIAFGAYADYLNKKSKEER